MNLDIIKRSKIFLTSALIIVLISWFFIAFFGLKPGIDLSGGTQWRISFDNPQVSLAELDKFFSNDLGVKSIIKSTDESDFIIEIPNITEETHQQYKNSIEEKFGAMTEKSFSSVGPTIGQELKNKSMWAVFGVLFGIFIFVAWAFREVSYPIKSWKYGSVALITLLHDVSIPAGVFAVLGYFQGIEVDTTFIVALLVVLGFSVNDTIVVFDRIRENLVFDRNSRKNLKNIINSSINETFVRSINTSFTLILVLISLLVFGPSSLFYFILTILIGTLVGTYSSIFVASPLLYLWGRE